MDWDLVLIFGFILTMMLIIMPMAYLFQRRAAEHEERRLVLIARAEEAKASEKNGSGTYRKLEERVRVLERIATDGNHALAMQIEELRDLHEIEDRTAPRETAQ
jgi:hypothetical protein